MLFKKFATGVLPVLTAILILTQAAALAESVPGVLRVDLGRYKPGVQPAKLSEYVSLSEVQAAFKLTVTADPVSQIHRVRGPKVNAVICPGMTRFVMNGSYQEFDIPVVYLNGELVVPRDFASILRRQAPPPVERQKKNSLPVTVVESLPEEFTPRTIVLDVGHGGKDPGATGPTGQREKEVALDVALKLRRLLQIKGHTVYMTRAEDKFLELEQRTDYVRTIQPHLFLSIHANAAENTTVTGIETFYGEKPMSLGSGVSVGPKVGDLNKRTNEKKQRPTKWTRDLVYDIYFQEFHTESQRLAYCVQNALMEAIPMEKNRGVKQRRFFVVRWSQSPSALVELGFLSNAATERKMKTAEYRAHLAKALYEGLLDYLY